MRKLVLPLLFAALGAACNKSASAPQPCPLILSVSPSSTILGVGQSATLTLAAPCVGGQSRWRSSDSTIAAIAGVNGSQAVVVGRRVGTATLFGTFLVDSSASGSAQVKVVSP